MMGVTKWEGVEMTGYTKGPWHMEGPQLVGNGYGIGHVTSHSTSEGKANARLIAAAPDLLEALELVMSNQTGLQENIDAAKKARAAIARAKGEE
jgi:hypothetical protein